MPRKEFLRLMQDNVLLLDKLGQRLKPQPSTLPGITRHQAAALVRLSVGGTARLKDIADRELQTTPNLCAMFRKLERDGLVLRTVDDVDRRNTWYSITDAGRKIADAAIEQFRMGLREMFADIGPDDEMELIGALKTMNEVLKKLELKNA